ncbi:MAG: 1-acyl-sn-glycerol-3-phosphate acyltransferase [Saprospiraceae bacterium]|nr:1-acyl-sn-glycerol-3-phosphate acyltransferase [Saprospiraceae bacterium]
MGDDKNLKPEIYRDTQVRAAIRELFSYQDFLDGMEAFVPYHLNKLILEEKNHIKTAHDFQKNVISPFLNVVKKSTISTLTFSGLKNLSPDESYLFISNHRDIVLDSAFLNMVLLENNMQTSQIAIGDNLVANRLTELIFRINKSFVVKRSGNPRDIYQYAILLSNYIYKTINKKKDSIWIAQREGRAKDGNDRTQIALLKMLSLSNKKQDLKQHFKNIKIVPVSISYEYDPCGFLKAKEHLDKQVDPNYKKTFHQDAEHLLLGIKGHKGNVHFHFEKPLSNRLDQLDNVSTSKEKLKLLAAIIDKSIHLNYKMNPINYYAYDILSKTNCYQKYYEGENKKSLVQFFAELSNLLSEDQKEDGIKFLLKSYANPLINANSY